MPKKNASIIEKGLDADSKPGWEVRGKIRVLLLPDRAKLFLYVVHVIIVDSEIFDHFLFPHILTAGSGVQ